MTMPMLHILFLTRSAAPKNIKEDKKHDEGKP